MKTKSAKLIVAHESDIAKAFTEWDRRYRANPEKFQSEAVRLLKGNPKSYGEWCAPYFIKLLGATCLIDIKKRKRELARKRKNRSRKEIVYGGKP